jgi:hypothetical protein
LEKSGVAYQQHNEVGSFGVGVGVGIGVGFKTGVGRGEGRDGSSVLIKGEGV